MPEQCVDLVEGRELNSRQKYALYLAVIVLVAIIMFPPYFGIDIESEGSVHAFVGYRPIWIPPTSEQVYEALVASGVGDVEADRMSSYQARLNVVQLALNIVVLLVATSIALVVFRQRRADN